ncbi:hypothetical protein, partial [Bacteroides sp.]|uniref:hypothetical protein n=1 Tax=Bacteroides sp. TaxID=29523 RepID=UPI0023CE469F
RVSCHKGKKYNVKERMTNRKYPLTPKSAHVSTLPPPRKRIRRRKNRKRQAISTACRFLSE